MEALHSLKEIGFLTREFLAVLPNAKDELGNSEDDKRFDQIRTSIVDAFDEQPLTPTFAKAHAPAKHLYQAKDALKKLVSDEDIELLINGRGVVPCWAANTDKEGSRIHRFMSGLSLREWDFNDFLETVAGLAEEDHDEPDEDFMNWLSAKSPEWLQELYSKLIDEKEIEDEIYQLSTARIVRLSDGSFTSAQKCYFPDEHNRFTDIVPCVDPVIFEIGNSKARKKNARKFLDEIGVREIGERELVEVLLDKGYVTADRPLQEKNYVTHLRRFMKLAKDDPSAISLLKQYKLFMGDDG
ncbi:MAG: hypothetical protein ACSHXD_05025 [Marinosulfonomonas sp.]